MTREEAKNILTCILHTNGDFMDYLDREDVEAIKFLANDERPHGEWKQVTAKDGEYYCYHKCTNCGQTIESGFDNPPLFNFCPNCGADMRTKEGEQK